MLATHHKPKEGPVEDVLPSMQTSRALQEQPLSQGQEVLVAAAVSSQEELSAFAFGQTTDAGQSL